MRLRTGARLALFAALSASAGCAALLALDDVTYAPAADAGSSLDATFDAGPSGADGAAIPCDASVATDPENCGRCNHTCLGGACVAGECQTFVIAQGDVLRGLAFSEKRVFFSERNAAGSIRSCELGKTCDGGRGDPVLPNHAGPLATDGTKLYWMDQVDDQVWSCPIVGCATQASPFAACAGGPTSADPDALAFIDPALVWRVPASSGPAELWGCAVTGGGPRRLVQVLGLDGFSTSANAGALIVELGHRLGVNGCDLSECDGGVGRALFDSGGAPVHGVAISGSRVFFSVESNPRAIRSIGVDGTGPVLDMAMPSNPGNPFVPADVVVHDGVVYWATVHQSSGASVVEHCDPTGDAAALCLGAGLPAPTFLDAGTTSNLRPGSLVVNGLGMFWFTSQAVSELRGRAW